MKVVDKRRETDEWHAGDVICYWNKPKSNHEVIEAWRKVIRGENHEKKR